ncbi:MAG: PPC domain-containing protein, partial [Planctomycetia bacterium]|nr:PPC domain-containing protein [Planctomycetia bacterium]
MLLASGDSFSDPLTVALGPTLHAAQRSGFVSSSADYVIYRLDNLNAHDVVALSVDAQSIGSALDSRLRVFRDADGAGPLSPVEVFINDNFTGSDSRLTFQADGVSTYYVGVSASGNNTYDPRNAAPPSDSQASAQLGLTHGLFRLNVTRTQPAAVAASNLATASFEVVQDAAQAGDTVQLQYRIENRGTVASSAFDIQFLLSTDNRFGPGDTVLASVPALNNVASLAAGAALTGTATVTLPAGLTGERFIGMVLVPNVADGDDPADNANLARGVNWDRVTLLEPVVGAPGHTLAAALPLPAAGNAQTALTNITSSTADFYRFTVTEGGRLTARVTTTSGDTVLSLLRADGTLLIQSAAVSTTDASDFIAQHLTPGQYILRVASRTSTARYQLTTEFTPAASPLENLPLGFSPEATASGDFNGDGILDLAYGGSQLLVLLGLGDGSFSKDT